MFEIRTRSRSCAGCTRCCEGWLTGEAWGHRFRPGQPCGWRSAGGCAIYENRPADPCRSFECEWKRWNNIPEWMKPSEIGVILVSRQHQEWTYTRVVDCGRPIPRAVHEWAQQSSAQQQINILIPHDHDWCVYSGDSGFRDSIAKIYRVVSGPVDK